MTEQKKSKTFVTDTIDQEVEIGASLLKSILNSDRFYTQNKARDGKPFYIFSEYGDFIKGQLISKHSNAHINRTCSYRIKVWEMKRAGQDIEIGENHIEEFFANRQLQRLIDRNQLIGSIVRVVYVGRQKSNFGGHSAKVYQLFKDVGVFTEKETSQNGTTRKYKQRPRTKAKSGRKRARDSRAAR